MAKSGYLGKEENNMGNIPEKETMPPVIISFKKFLIAIRNENAELKNEALVELASYSAEDVRVLGDALDEIQKDVKKAEEEDAIDALSEKYAAEVEAAMRKKG